MRQQRSLLESLNNAFAGVIYSFKTQRSLRIHFLATGLVLLFALWFKVTKLELLALFFAIGLVVVTELINTALETAIDLITMEHHPAAAIAKHVAAGAVLIATFLAIIVGYLIFFPYLEPKVPRLITTLERLPAYLSLVAVLMTVLLVVALKTISKKGTPLRGGWISGHTALAAAAATSLLFVTRNCLALIAALFLVVLVAESRLENKAHKGREVLAGGVLGFLVTLLIFQLL